jgi:hypothetical protein
MDFLNFLLSLFVPPASLITLAFSWPALCFLNACEWLYNHIYGEDMDNKVVIITGASSAIGEASLYIFFIFIYKITPDQKVDEQQAALLNLTFLYNKTQLQDSLI